METGRIRKNQSWHQESDDCSGQREQQSKGPEVEQLDILEEQKEGQCVSSIELGESSKTWDGWGRQKSLMGLYWGI